MEAVLAVLHQYVNEQLLDGGSDELDASTPLLEWGVIDSLNMVDLLSFIEHEFGVRIPDEDVLPENFATLRAISRLVAALGAGPSRSAALHREGGGDPSGR